MSDAWDVVLRQRYPRKPGEADLEASIVLTETEAAITDRIRAEEVKRSTSIIAACALAGQSGRAAAFIAEGRSLTDVLAALGSRKRIS